MFHTKTVNRTDRVANKYKIIIMRFSKDLAKAYGITEDYAILVIATWHLQTPTEDDLQRVPYYSHRLPKGLSEITVTSQARRAIKEGEDLQEIVDRISNLDIFPTEQEILNINEMLKTHDIKHQTPKELRKAFQERGKLGFQILKHAAIYQKKILEHEYGGVLPRKLPEIIQQINLVNQKAEK